MSEEQEIAEARAAYQDYLSSFAPAPVTAQEEYDSYQTSPSTDIDGSAITPIGATPDPTVNKETPDIRSPFFSEQHPLVKDVIRGGAQSVGGLVGGGLGAITGGTIGTALPGPGTLAGAVTGGTAGAALGGAIADSTVAQPILYLMDKAWSLGNGTMSPTMEGRISPRTAIEGAVGGALSKGADLLAKPAMSLLSKGRARIANAGEEAFANRIPADGVPTAESQKLAKAVAQETSDQTAGLKQFGLETGDAPILTAANPTVGEMSSVKKFSIPDSYKVAKEAGYLDGTRSLSDLRTKINEDVGTTVVRANVGEG